MFERAAQGMATRNPLAPFQTRKSKALPTRLSGNSLAFRGTAWKELVRKRSEGLQQIYSNNSMKIRVLVVTDGLGVLIHL